jgi:hypothetical protein
MHWPHMPNPEMWKEYQLLQLLPVPPPAPLDGIGHTCQTQTCGESTSFYQFHHQHHLMALDDAKPYSVGSGYRTSPTNSDNPIHGSGAGEIVFRHMGVVQHGLRSADWDRRPAPEA